MLRGKFGARNVFERLVLIIVIDEKYDVGLLKS